jgi:hypothetical protein
MARLTIVALAILTLGLVGVLVWGSWRVDGASAVDDLPSVAEVVAAQAHRHGVALPELSDEDRVRLSAPPTPGSRLPVYDQVLIQLLAVRDAAGMDEAVAILGEVARQSEAISAECPRLYAEITTNGVASRSLAQTCPA